MSRDTERRPAPRWAIFLVLTFTFLSFFMVPVRVQSLRRRFASALPEQWAQVADNGPYRAVLPYKDLGYADEGLYAARARQIVLHGRPYGPWLGNRALKSWVFDCLMFYPIAIFIWLCGGNLALGWTLAHAVLGCGWILMLYSIFRAYGEDEPLALMSAAFILFFINTLNEAIFVLFYCFEKPAAFVFSLRNLPSTIFLPISLFMRQPSPAASYLWIAAGVAGALTLSRSPKRRPLAAAAIGTICGLLCFVHFFEWVCGVLTLCLLAAEIHRDPEAPETGRFNLTLSAGVAGAISCVYYLFARHMTADSMHDIIDLNSTWGRRFSLMSIPFLLFALLFWRLGERRRGARRQILMAAAAVEAAAFVAANLSLVLGYDMQFGEHAAYSAAFAAMIGLSCWAMDLDALRKYLRPHALVLTAFFCAWFAFKAKAWADLHFKFYGIPQDVADAYDWMNGHVPKDSTLLALSAPINFLTPLEAEMRSTVSFAQLAGEPITTEANLRAFAALLKTMDVVPERFLRERWRIGDVTERDRAARAEDMAETLDWDDRERMLWPFFLRLDTNPDPQDSRRAEAWRQILGYLQEAQPIRRVFYEWVQKGDEPLLRRTPIESGGQLIYHNSSVSLYSFPNGVLTTSPAPKHSRS